MEVGAHTLPSSDSAPGPSETLSTALSCHWGSQGTCANYRGVLPSLSGSDRTVCMRWKTKHEIFCDMSHCLIKCTLTVSLNAQVCGGCQDVLLRAVEEVGPKCGLGARADKTEKGGATCEHLDT